MRRWRSDWVPRSFGPLMLVIAIAAACALAIHSPAGAGTAPWPRGFDSAAGAFVIYQPQPEDLVGDVLTGRAAFSLQKQNDSTPIFGVLWFSERVQIDRDSSTVSPRGFDVTKVRLPGITPPDASRYESLVETESRHWDLSGSVDELKAGLASAQKERASVAGLDNTAPHIQFANERAILLVYDGAPVLEPIAGSRLERVANTPYAVVFDSTNATYYLNGANLWYRSNDPLGPWDPIANPPRAVALVVPADTSSADQLDGPPPRVFAATEPTELISIDGEPKYAPLVGEALLYVTNTECDVLRDVAGQELFVLIAGRWYRAPSPEGPWTFVRGDALPPSFARVPPNSPKGNILASVAGTDQADDAIADAEIPQTSVIPRDEPFFEAVYDGAAQFEPIAGTALEYAVNTGAEVIFADHRYYACDQGIWFIANTPYGPWLVSDTRPLGIDDVPPSCPIYDSRFVNIYDSTPDMVYVGYLPGYVGCYPYYGTVVYGTGYRYRPWLGHRRYFPRPQTWGFLPRYNPWIGRWSFCASFASGFLHVGFRWHSRGEPDSRDVAPRWLGAGGYHRPLIGDDNAMLRERGAVRYRGVVAERVPMNLYNRVSARARGGDSPSATADRKASTPRLWGASKPNDVFAGKDGKVYRRDRDGGWRVNVGRTWQPMPMPYVRARASALPASGPSGGSAPGAASGERTASPPATRPEREPQTRRDWNRSSTPAPAPAPAPALQPVPAPAPAPAQPAPVAPDPGNLEREYRARERGGGGSSTPSRPAPPPAPSNPAPQQRAPRDFR